MIVTARAVSYQNLKALRDIVIQDPSTLIISILDTRGTSPNYDLIYPETDGPKVYMFRFDDYGSIPEDEQLRQDVFSFEQAERMCRAIDKAHRWVEEVNLVAQCGAGVSRSGAVVDFVQQYARLPWSEFSEMNPQIKPNQLVLRTLKEVSGLLREQEGAWK